MSSNTWTPLAVSSESFHGQRRLWRAVEAQHIASTMRLVDSVDEQAVLEKLLEESKPPLPADALPLHYLLATPFRYTSAHGSRFRAAAAAGVWYGAEAQRTACAELGFWRWRFLMDSEALASLGPSPQTVFKAGVHARMVDLTQPPFEASHAEWTHPNDYAATQRFAAVAREAGIDAIRYQSVRDPQHGRAVAVLRPSCFRPLAPLEEQTWFLTVRRAGVVWQRHRDSFEFDAGDWRAAKP